jgi:hypothetical protein
MGFDTSFHPVDVALVRDRLLPYIAGDGADDDLDDLVGRAVALRRVRFRAKSWALGAHQAAEKLGIDGLVSDVHVWGRPFFVVADGPDEVAEAVLRYVATPLDGVDALAKEMAGRIDPRLADGLAPDDSGRLPGDEELGQKLRWRLGLLRASGAALRAGGRPVRDRDQEHDAAQLMAREVPFSVVEFAACLTPGWMSRGYVWPTTLCSAAGVPATGFTAPEPLFAALRERFAGIDWFSAPTITENYMVGGFVAAADVSGARAALTANRAVLLEPPRADDWDDYALANLVKIDEALALAERLGHGFCEATEIYSGFEGNLN